MIAIHDEIIDKKFQYNSNREVAKILALSSGKLINMNILQVKKYYFLVRVEWISKSNRLSWLTALGKALEKQKNNWKSRWKAIKRNWKAW